MKLTKEQRENCRKMAGILNSGYENFLWSETDEGFDFWEKVYHALEKYGKEPEEKCEKCGRKFE